MTTIHTQDYKDAPGDAAAGRVTLPIAYPTLSRAVTAFLLIAWSRGISWTWRLDDITAGFVGVLAFIVGVSFVARRGGRADILSSYLYNVSSTIRVARAFLTRSLLVMALCYVYSSWVLQVAHGIVTSWFCEIRWFSAPGCCCAIL